NKEVYNQRIYIYGGYLADDHRSNTLHSTLPNQWIVVSALVILGCAIAQLISLPIVNYCPRHTHSTQPRRKKRCSHLYCLRDSKFPPCHWGSFLVL
ncbi:hypothetical protein GBAR_LOCUS10333, partial [Geodia barretti]